MSFVGDSGEATARAIQARAMQEFSMRQAQAAAAPGQQGIASSGDPLAPQTVTYEDLTPRQQAFAAGKIYERDRPSDTVPYK